VLPPLDESTPSLFFKGKHMTKILAEEDVTLDNITVHLKDSGLVPVATDAAGIWLRIASGVAYCIAILDDKKFIRIWTFLPLDRDQPRDMKLDLEHQLNAEIYLPVFSLDHDDDLNVSYLMPYEQGLIAGQFVAIVNRFGSVLDYIVEFRNENGLIKFDRGNAASEDDQMDFDTTTLRPAGVLLN
jgi:hypothetical protein